MDRLSALYLWAGFIIVYSIRTPDTFLTTLTWKVTFAQGVVTAVVALAFLLPMVAGAFDLSVGAVFALSLVTTSWLAQNTDLPPAVGAMVAIGAGCLCGAVTGFIVVRLNVESFIASLGISQVLTAAVIYISNNAPITDAFSDGYTSWGRREVFGVPILIYYLVVIVAILWFVLEHTSVGRSMYATGGNPEAARLAGVRTDAMVWGSLIGAGFLAALAGVLYSMKSGTFSVSDGPGYLFPAATAVLFGASQLSRRPNVLGTMIALFALAFGIKGLQLLIPAGGYWIPPLFEGVALVLAVALASRTGKIGRKRASGRERA